MSEGSPLGNDPRETAALAVVCLRHAGIAHANALTVSIQSHLTRQLLAGAVDLTAVWEALRSHPEITPAQAASVLRDQVLYLRNHRGIGDVAIPPEAASAVDELIDVDLDALLATLEREVRSEVARLTPVAAATAPLAEPERPRRTSEPTLARVGEVRPDVGSEGRKVLALVGLVALLAALLGYHAWSGRPAIEQLDAGALSAVAPVRHAELVADTWIRIELVDDGFGRLPRPEQAALVARFLAATGKPDLSMGGILSGGKLYSFQRDDGEIAIVP